MSDVNGYTPRVMNKSQLLWSTLFVAAIGCDSAFEADAVFEDSLTISEGVAGVYAKVSNQPGESPDGVEGVTIEVFDAAALVDNQLTGDPVNSTTTSEDGFFEMQLAPADYVVADGSDRTSKSSFTVAGAVVRCDLSGSEEGQSWSCR